MSAEPQLFRINPENKDSKKITEVDFAQLGLKEQRDIQEWVADNPSILDEDLLIIGKEFSGFDRVNERLDLLAVDKDGKLVVIELKRDDTGADAHWQAVKYASYLQHATHEDIIRMLDKYEKDEQIDTASRLLKHLNSDDLNSLNNDQRIILASHRFAPQVTSAALWLNEKALIEDLITCVQLTPFRDPETQALYVQANTIIPIPGTEEYSIGLGETSSGEDNGQHSSFRENLRKTFQRHRNDKVTEFLRKTTGIALGSLTDETQPDKRSKWAGGGYDKRIAGGRWRRYYHLWYGNSSPWGNWSVSYRMNLYPETESGSWESGPWSVNLELAYLSNALANRVVESSVGDELISNKDCVATILTSDALDDQFANTLANTLKNLIENATHVVNEFEEERANQEDA